MQDKKDESIRSRNRHSHAEPTSCGPSVGQLRSRAGWMADKKIIPVCYGNLSMHSSSIFRNSSGELAVRGVLPSEKRQPSAESRADIGCCSVQGHLGRRWGTNEGRRIRAFGERARGIQGRLTGVGQGRSRLTLCGAVNAWCQENGLRASFY
jgi:hypothetical protein